MQLYSQAIKDYFKSKPNNRKLLKYGQIFGIEDKIRTYGGSVMKTPEQLKGTIRSMAAKEKFTGAGSFADVSV